MPHIPQASSVVQIETNEHSPAEPHGDVIRTRVERGSDFLAGDAWLVLAADVADALEAHPELVELLEQEK